MAARREKPLVRKSCTWLPDEISWRSWDAEQAVEHKDEQIGDICEKMTKLEKKLKERAQDAK